MQSFKFPDYCHSYYCRLIDIEVAADPVGTMGLGKLTRHMLRPRESDVEHLCRSRFQPRPELARMVNPLAEISTGGYALFDSRAWRVVE